MSKKNLVLIVEDEPALSQIIQERLQIGGFITMLVQDDESVFKAFIENSPTRKNLMVVC